MRAGRRRYCPAMPAAPRLRPPIALVVFVVGAASLGTEIAAARLLAPYFGASTFVWANTIATVLVALSAGYAIGGRLADRAPHLAGLCRLVLAAAVLLAVVPFVSGPFLRASARALSSISAGAFVGSLVGVLVLVAVPVFLLGAAAPYAIRLTVARIEESGRVSGRLYAISTAGSLVGTFASALLLIPLVGTRRTFLAFALSLAVVAVLGLRRRRAAALAPLALVGLLALPVGGIDARADGRPGARVVYEAETPYQYARVVQQPGGARWLELNEGQAIHSLYRPHGYLTGNYWDDLLVLPLAGRRGVPARMAILGNAAGTTARAYGHYFPRTTIDAVELDGELTRIGERWFGLRPGRRLHTITADARPWLAGTDHRYDAIVVDAYRQPYIPFYLTTREFFADVRAHLRPGGLVLVNVGHPPRSDQLEQVVSATLGAVFETVRRDPVDATNSLAVAGDSPIEPSRLARAAGGLAPELRPLASKVARRLGPALPGGAVYTDDRAPVEWLIDAAIVRYAAGQR